jgi:hypothetical protein
VHLYGFLFGQCGLALFPGILGQPYTYILCRRSTYFAALYRCRAMVAEALRLIQVRLGAGAGLQAGTLAWDAQPGVAGPESLAFGMTTHVLSLAEALVLGGVGMARDAGLTQCLVRRAAAGHFPYW